MKACPLCLRPYEVPREELSEMQERHLAIPCSPFHVRCITCKFPVANKPMFIRPDGRCIKCGTEKKKRSLRMLA